MSHGRIPDDVDALHVDVANLVVSPALEGVDEASGMASVHRVSLHVHLAGAHAFDGRGGQEHPSEHAVSAVGAERGDGGHHELVEMGAGRCPLLVLGPRPLAHDPCLHSDDNHIDRQRVLSSNLIIHDVILIRNPSFS